MAKELSREPRPRVLIVEDEPVIRLVARDILEDAGFDVVEADSGQEAVRMLEMEAGIVAVFTDVHMPGAVDGLSLARMVPERWPDVRIAVTSGRARPEVGELPAGTLFVPKPYRPEQLVARLQELVSGGSSS